MVADVDVGFPGMNIFPSADLIGNEIQFAERPGPKLQELVADGAILFTDEEGDENAREIQYHEKGKYKQNPRNVELRQDGTD